MFVTNRELNMAAKDRMKKRRQRVLKNGGKTLSVLIDQDTVIQLKHLKSHFQESQAALVARAIANLYMAPKIPAIPEQPPQTAPEKLQILETAIEETDSKPNSDELLMKIILGQ